MLLDTNGRGAAVMLHEKMTGDENIQAGLWEMGLKLNCSSSVQGIHARIRAHIHARIHVHLHAYMACRAHACCEQEGVRVAVFYCQRKVKRRASDKSYLWAFNSAYILRLDMVVHPTVLAEEIVVPAV